MIVGETAGQKRIWEVMRKFPLRVELAGHPPSVNHTYQIFRGRMFKNAKANAWETLSAIHIRTAAKLLYGVHDLGHWTHRPLELEISLYRSTWKGKGKDTSKRYIRKDLTNVIKIAEDCLCKALGLEDAAVISMKASKLVDAYREDYTVLTLRFLG